MTNIPRDTVQDEQIEHTEVREEFERQLGPGERLLAFAKGQVTVGFSARPFLLGLTPDRLILLPPRGRKATAALTLWRENVRQLKWSRSSSRVEVHFDGAYLEFVLRGGYWKRHTMQLLDIFGKLPPNTPPTLGMMTQRSLSQARDFKALGLYALAQAQLAKLEVASSSEARSEIKNLSNGLADIRLGLRVGAGFLTTNAGLTILLVGLFVDAQSSLAAAGIFVLSALIDLFIAANLWRGRGQRWVPYTIARTLIPAVFAAINYAVLAGLLLQLAFTVSILLVLLGQPRRARTLVAIGLFAFGYVGVFLITIFGGVVFLPMQ